MSTTRRDLIDAQKAIFRNQDEEEAQGIPHTHPGETSEYLALHRRYYALEREMPRWKRVGVWGQALRQHERDDEQEAGR